MSKTDVELNNSKSVLSTQYDNSKSSTQVRKKRVRKPQNDEKNAEDPKEQNKEKDMGDNSFLYDFSGVKSEERFDTKIADGYVASVPTTLTPLDDEYDFRTVKNSIEEPNKSNGFDYDNKRNNDSFDNETNFDFAEGSILGKLHSAIGEKKPVKTAEDLVIHYVDKTIRPIEIDEDANLLLSNGIVYVNGFQNLWDSMYEVKLKSTDLIELELGLTFDIPIGVTLHLDLVNEAFEKYRVSLDSPIDLTFSNSGERILLSLKADTGGFISKRGFLVKANVFQDKRSEAD